VEWGVDNPEYFDHFLEQHYTWRREQHAVGWERGVLSAIALDSFVAEGKPKVLELCCGDGFNTFHFYSVKADSVVAVDFDERAIAAARRNNSASNISYRVCDIRSEIPQGRFDNVIWDAAIEHFTEDETNKILLSIKSSLTESGVLSGYTLLEQEEGEMHLHQHEREFTDMNDLARVLLPHFRNVHILHTSSPSRENLYFFASDGTLPFDSSSNLKVSR
jgi:SAM-dependent methyltransferase